MPRDVQEAVRIQRKYYAETASQYNSMHAHEGDDDASTLKLVSALLRSVEATTLLDVGSGTGRGVRQFATAMPGLSVRGIEPVAALIQQAARADGLPPGSFLQGSGEALPFADETFDVVCSSALLHHVPQPRAVIQEMLRVARKAVIISDSNRFGQGRPAMRVTKLLLYKLHLWGVVNFLKTRGKGYLITEGDGLAYSFSVYDSFELIAAWADRVILIPVDTVKPKSWLHPLLTSGGVIVCALKETR
ncbi:MAG TPA: class I SAM-dependent methyltransferase [Candidatus Acidoferrales bacterium]|nr:class I SAM-dependent methyltransferase [Candidatus Acidoferrales bacterium]